MLRSHTFKTIATCAVIALTSASCAQYSGHSPPTQTSIPSTAASPYAGEQSRDIKSLSASEIASLRNGAGMGYAKAAELNGYPGPMHVLELARHLKLSNEQRSASENLMAQHKAKARAMGVQLIEAERALDTAFVSKQVDAVRIGALTERIGSVHAALRAEHLQTHLLQTALLSPMQIASYQSLRGYDKTGAVHQHHGH